MNRKLRMGMVGGGRGAFIGAVHRMAANLDGQVELVAGAFSSDPEKSKLSGQDLFLDPIRVYSSYEDMALKEAALPENQRIDFVSIVVQNHLHFAVAKTFLEAGFHVICEKPVTQTLQQAYELHALVQSSGKIFVLTHNYTGYPMVKEARRMVQDGELGRILKIVAEYPQGYATGDIEGSAAGAISNWRADPNIAGMSNCIGDIGTHAHNLARYITGLEISEMCADLSVFVPGRQLDDDGNILVRFDNGARGIVFASQISNGDENGLAIRIYGTKASLEWHQEDPNELLQKSFDGPSKTYRRGNDYLSDVAKNCSRTPFGHPEGYIEGFANIYLEAVRAIRDRIEGNPAPAEGYDFPTIRDGIAGMAFIETAVRSTQATEKWVPFPALPEA